MQHFDHVATLAIMYTCIRTDTEHIGCTIIQIIHSNIYLKLITSTFPCLLMCHPVMAEKSVGINSDSPLENLNEG